MLLQWDTGVCQEGKTELGLTGGSELRPNDSPMQRNWSQRQKYPVPVRFSPPLIGSRWRIAIATFAD